MLVRDLTDGVELDQVLLVRAAELRTKADGEPYLRLTLGDRTGAAVAMVWEDVARIRELCPQGTAIHVRARFERHPKYGPQLRLRGLGPAQPGTYDPADLRDGPPRSAEAMESDLRELVATIQDEHLRTLLDRVLGSQTATWAAYRRAPAAKHYHQAYEHGLLEHSLSVAQAVSATSATFPGIDRDVAVTGALLHDIGKLEAYTTDPDAIDLTDAGRLQGEIPLGYYRIRREIEEIPGFPAGLAQAVCHIILSHHGSLEHGSPVVPATREATLVHMIDNLGGRLGSFDRLEKELPPGAAWSSFDRALGGGAYFGAQAQDDAERAAA
ncbi:MAG TPA: HD domain-containing protein [Solirubrobacteraceae bacterium]|nr:HD domain-containing protein [Solirubrobacteraceae bacterium]